jgi:hypothetical protein
VVVKTDYLYFQVKNESLDKYRYGHGNEKGRREAGGDKEGEAG